MSVKCSAGYWNFDSKTGEIFSTDEPYTIAKVPVPSSLNENREKCISNAAVMTQSAEMYSLLIFIKSALETMYRSYPKAKGRILEYVEYRIEMIEENVNKIINDRPDES
ncbi:MAG: hypothetical protein IJP48_07155 [Synergistaceae bacterium]|nr:hypothetical protein [Synergistaceae bacterium]